MGFKRCRVLIYVNVGSFLLSWIVHSTYTAICKEILNEKTSDLS
jgi:hypothetical protein